MLTMMGMILKKCTSPTPQVTNTINKWWNELDAAPKYDVHALLILLQRVLEVFDNNHYYSMEIKRRIIENIGETKGFEYDNLAPAWLEKKVNFCREHLALQQVLAPGLSEYRAYISSHLVEPLYLLAKKRWDSAFSKGPLPIFTSLF